MLTKGGNYLVQSGASGAEAFVRVDFQRQEQRLAASGYVETFPGMWERPSAAHELLSKDAPMKLTACASMVEVER